MEGNGSVNPVESDETLVRRCRAGDRSAFAVLVDRYAPAVNAVAIYRLRNHHLAEDVAQDVFVTAFQKLASLRVDSMFGRWILKIAGNEAIRAQRQARRDVSLDDVGDVVALSASDDEMESERLLHALMRLPEREHRLIMLRYFGHHTIEQLAEITHRPVGTVTKQLSRGYARLREMLTEVTT